MFLESAFRNGRVFWTQFCALYSKRLYSRALLATLNVFCFPVLFESVFFSQIFLRLISPVTTQLLSPSSCIKALVALITSVLQLTGS